MKNECSKMVKFVFLILIIFVLFPTVYTIANSFMAPDEILRYYGSGTDSSKNQSIFHIIPDTFSFESYYQVFLRRPDYLIKFWYSLILCFTIVFGQVIVSVLGGFAFAKLRIPFKKIIYFILILLMLMPIQVMLIPNYIVLDKMQILGTLWALILPAIFSPFGTFILTQMFKEIPDEIAEAARLDGANTLQVLLYIFVPSASGGMVSLGILTFIDSWNMVEQPLIYLKKVSQYPLSVFLSSVNMMNFSLAFACAILSMIPVTLMFLYFNQELIEGIEFSGIK